MSSSLANSFFLTTEMRRVGTLIRGHLSGSYLNSLKKSVCLKSTSSSKVAFPVKTAI
ncbi:hypothetical protein AB205_0133040 [Aquarana catesbeiana]|uniref:Uncharacterized protein n=1 Tax=Aquarana catesbeiana TaxID=8400 RepID=A0A2G9RY70_AQUCT|nr:hypothetical protein AB205_0133040 [Aquarana catesbeiana]PIO32856.1 hypothetical protein AB205_0133040 [Aquarana catesbeiana]